MAEYKLSYTASEIDRKLGKIDNMSWNDLKDKPFYSEIAEGVAVFDGDMTGKEYMEAGDGLFLVKMSDDPLTPEQLIGSTIIMKHTAYGDEQLECVVTENDIAKEDLDESSYMMMVASSEMEMPVVYVICGDLSSVGVPITQGTYYVCIADNDGYLYTHSLSCLNGMREVVHKIDAKYLPEVGLAASEVKAMINEAIGDAIGGSY